jgi:hypothetical protein
MVLCGDGKIGKTTFAASAPDSIGILTEDGMRAIDGNAFPICKSLDDVYACISTLLNEEHQFRTVFLDSLDWLEPLLGAHVAKANGWKDLETPGYGRGHVAAAGEWRTLLDGFEALRAHRDMSVILISHVLVKRIEDPTHEGYDAFVLKLHSKASALVSEWADVIGFAAHKVAIDKVDAGFGTKETKAKRTGQRVLHLEPHPAYPSGNRFGLKDCALQWSTFMDALQTAQQ